MASTNAHLNTAISSEQSALSRLSMKPVQMGFWLILLAVIVLSLADYNSFPLGNYLDDSWYSILARSLVQGPTFGDISAPGEAQASRYSFGFPLILSPLIHLFPTSFDVWKLVSLVFTLVNAMMIYRGWSLLVPGLSRWWALLVLGMAFVSPLVIMHTRMVMSEPVFTTWLIASCLLIEHLARHPENPRLRAIGLGLTVTLAIYTRNIGVVLIPVIMIRFVVALKPRQIIVTLGWMGCCAVMFLVSVVLLTPIQPHDLLPVSHSDQLQRPEAWDPYLKPQSFSERVVNVAMDYITEMIRTAILFVGGGQSEAAFGQRLGIPNLPQITSSLVTVLVAIGLAVMARRRQISLSVILTILFYVLVLIVWPWALWRFLYPLQLFLQLGLLIGIAAVVGLIFRSRWPRLPVIAAGAAGIVLIGLSLWRVIPLPNRSADSTPVRNFAIEGEWLRANTPVDSVVLAPDPQSVFLYADRRMVPYSNAIDSPAALEATIDQYGVDYIVVAPKVQFIQEGGLRYGRYIETILLPLLDSMAQQGRLRLDHRAEDQLPILIYAVVGTEAR